jgi:hypothetical protein
VGGGTAPGGKGAQRDFRLDGPMSRPRFLADNDLNDAIVVASDAASRQLSLRGFETSGWRRGATPNQGNWFVSDPETITN